MRVVLLVVCFYVCGPITSYVCRNNQNSGRKVIVFCDKMHHIYGEVSENVSEVFHFCFMLLEKGSMTVCVFIFMYMFVQKYCK